MNRRIDPIRTLERSPYFKGLPVSTLHALSMFADELSFKVGEQVIKRGEPASAIYLLHAGELVAEGAGGDVVGAGALVGHMDVVSGQPASVTLTAREVGIAVVFTQASVKRLFEDRGAAGSAFRRAIIMSFSDQLRAANQAIAAYVAANPQAGRPSRGFLDELTGVLSGTRTNEPRKR